MNPTEHPSSSSVSSVPSSRLSSPAAPDEATLLRLLVDAAQDFAIFAVDPDGTILTWNPGVQNITGYEEHEVHRHELRQALYA
jgi:PAS domain-containing protein